MTNDVVAESKLPSTPVATTLYVLGESDGTVKVQVKAPEPEVICPLQVWVDGVAPLNVNELMRVLGVNPEPLTLREPPIGP